MRPALVVLACIAAAACSEAGSAPSDAGQMRDGGTNSEALSDGETQRPDAGDAALTREDPPPDPATCAFTEVLCVDDDTGPAHEYGTIQEAVDAARPGDTVLVFAGSYAGFTISRSGTSTARLTVRAAPGTLIVSPAAGVQNAIRIRNASYVTIDGFTIARDGTHQPYDYDYACIAAREAEPQNPMHGIVIRNTEVSGCSPSGMYLSEVEGLLLENNNIHHNVVESENGNGNGVYLANAGTDNVIVRGNRFIANEGSGIHFNGDESIGGDGIQTGHTFERNLVAHNGGNGFNMDGVQDCLFVNNVFARNGHHGVRGFRIDAAEGPRGSTFVNNTFIGNHGAAVKMTDDTGGDVLFNNLSTENTEGDWDINPTAASMTHNTTLPSADGAFINAAGDDFRLVPDSPPVGAGVRSFSGKSAPADDFNRFARSGTPDNGALAVGSVLP